jgi:hypothetical protein
MPFSSLLPSAIKAANLAARYVIESVPVWLFAFVWRLVDFAQSRLGTDSRIFGDPLGNDPLRMSSAG